MPEENDCCPQRIESHKSIDNLKTEAGGLINRTHGFKYRIPRGLQILYLHNCMSVVNL